MPYRKEKTDDGIFVVKTDTGERKNKDPMDEKHANEYLAALYAAETKKEVSLSDEWAFTMKDDAQDGIMIALLIPYEQAESLALKPEDVPEGAEVIPADQLHVTLTYLGTIQDATFTAKELLGVLSIFATGQAPITGSLNGYGKFVVSHKEGLQVCYLNFDSPQLPDFHHELLEVLEEMGLEFESNHGFTPHVTLAYTPEGEEIKTLPALPIEITFDRFMLAYGEEWYEFYLSGSPDEETEGVPTLPEGVFLDEPQAEGMYSLASTEKGNPNHAQDGKFTSGTGGGGASSEKLPGNVKVIEGKKPPAKTKLGRVPVTGSGVSEIKGQKIAFYSGKINGKKAFTFDEGKTWAGNKLDALISAMGGFDAAEPFLRWSPTQKENRLTQILDALTGLFVKPKMTGGDGFFTIKEKDGNYRWVSFSSNPYRDRDRQYVALKALQNDVARADSDGDYGPLLWWHTNVVLGDCDFNTMIGKILVESGTFVNKEVGKRVTKSADSLQVSLGMFHPRDQPDQDGIFHVIRRYERSILPAGRASNPLTAFIVKEFKMSDYQIDSTKEAQLKTLLGPQVAADVIKQALFTQKQADDAGLTFVTKAKAVAPEDETMMEEEEETVPPVPPAKAKKEAVTLADMSGADFAAMLAGAVSQAVSASVKETMTPVLQAVGNLAQTQTQKETQTAQAAAEQAQTIKNLSEKLTGQEQALAQTRKELQSALAGLTGDLPPALAQFVKAPSQRGDNLTTKENIPNQPQADPLDTFFKFANPYAQNGNGQ